MNIAIKHDIRIMQRVQKEYQCHNESSDLSPSKNFPKMSDYRI
jgi:hypothetical protein